MIFLLGAAWATGAVGRAAESPIMDVGSVREMGVKEIGAAQRHGLGFADEGRFVVAGDVWTLAVALEMATFRKTVNRLSVQAKQMASLAKNFSQVATGADYHLSEIEAEYVGTVSALLDAELDNIDADLTSARHYLEAVEMATPVGRSRRAWIPIIGDALQTVFGTATQRDLKRVQGELANLKVQQRELGHVVESQLSLLNTTFLDQSKVGKQLDQLARANKLMAEEARALLNRTQELAREEDRDHLLDILGARLRVVHATLGRLRADLDRFLTGWTTAAQHHLSPALLPPKDFLDALRGIQNKLPGGSTLLFPADDNNIGAHYASCRVTVTRISGGLLLFVDLPVTRPDMTFDLLRAVPLPVAVGKDGVFAMIAPEVPYLAVSLDQKHSIEMDQEDLAGCQEGTVRVCNPQHPLRYAGNGNEGDCLLSLYRGEAEKVKGACQVVLVKSPAPTLYRAKGTTTWLFSVASTEVVTAHCQVDPSSTPRPVHISGVGTLTLPPGCGASIGGMLLSAPAHFVSAYREAQLDSFVMPRLPAPTLANFTLPFEGVREDTLRKVDGLLNTTWGLDPVTAAGTALKLKDLRDRVKDYETAAAEQTTTTIHYVASMGTSGIVLVVMAILVAYYCCCARAAMCLGSCCLQSPAWTPLAPPLQSATWTPAPPPTPQVVYVAARDHQPATAHIPF